MIMRDGQAEFGELDELAGLLDEQGRTGEAEALWRAAVAGGMPGARVALAALLSGDDRPDEALAEYRAAVRDGEKHSRDGLATQLTRMGRLDEAIGEYRSMIADGVGCRVRISLAELCTRTGRYDEAIAVYRQAIDQDGASPWMLGEIYEKGGRLDDAIGAYRAAVEAGEDHARFRLARALAMAGRAVEATDEVRGWPGDRRFLQLGWLLTEQGRHGELDREAARLEAEDNAYALWNLIRGSQRSAEGHDGCEPGGTCRARVMRVLPR
ncbi:tetratricopeptide (TPR) repeat protein [Actinoplanes couchii]|nr:tetratricopeptide (TPR) repeat protein [Actinoplanes couchii]